MNERAGAEPDLLAELEILGSIALVAGRSRTSREVAAASLGILGRATAADGGVVLFDDGGGFDVEAGFGFPPGAVEAVVTDRSVSDQLAAALDASPGPIFGPVAKAPIRPEIAEQLLANGLTHVLAAPLRAAGRLVGILGLAWRAAPSPRPSDATILHVSGVLGASLVNAHLVEQLQRTLASERRVADEEAVLQSLTLIAETAGGFHELAATTVRQIMSLVGAVAGSYALVTVDDRVIHLASVGVDRQFIEVASDQPASEMLSVRRLLDDPRPYVQDYEAGAVSLEALELVRKRGWTTFALLPITVRDRLEALIALHFETRPVLPTTERTLATVSRIASISLANFRLRERLLASEARYRVLFEEAPTAVVLLSATNEIVDANSAALRLYRTSLAGLRAFLASGGPRVSDEETRRRRDIIARDGRNVFEDIGHRPDGTTFPEEMGIVPVEIDGEQRYLLIVRDLTEQGRLQGELVQAQKMEAIGQLVSGVAHELNNPLAAIVAFSQLIRRDQRLPEDMRHDAELLVQEADRTGRIVQNLLDFARQRPPERHPTSIGALLDSVLALQSYSLAAGRIELAIDIPPELPLIDVDRSQLQQVLLNLTLNAIQAIRAERAEGRIWVTARRVAVRREGARLRITISDNGTGIADDARSRLFLPFYTTKAPGQGTGLGLSVSFGIVAAHGGTLRFEPRPGGGATFIMELPVGGRSAPERRRTIAVGGGRDTGTDVAVMAAVGASGRSEAGARPQTEAGARRQTDAETRMTSPSAAPAPVGASSDAAPRVLVLDDEPAIRAFLTKSLRLADLDPIAVGEGREAIDLCRAASFAAVLVDHRMPGMSGTEVYDAIVSIRPELATRFVFMSGDVLNPELYEFATRRQIALLAKPFDVDTVNRLVGAVVAGTLSAEALRHWAPPTRPP